MPILTLQRQMRELGRIRTGNQVATGNGGGRRPNKLETFRLTSESRPLIDAAAQRYGGVVTPWINDGRQEFEVVTAAASLDIVVPPGQPVNQWYELWSGGGCQRRCDGVTNVLTMEPCLCPDDPAERVALAQKGEACKATTRLNVILPQLPDLGVWRLESHGYYAAVELAGAAEILAMASAAGRLIPARLRLEQRSKKEPGKPTKQYAVPIIEFTETRFGNLGLTTQAAGDEAPRLTAGGAVTPGRPELPATTVPADSDFRPPAPRTVATIEERLVEEDRLQGRSASEAPGAPAEPEVAAGATTEPPAAGGQPDAPVSPIDHTTLVAALSLAEIPLADAVERSKVLFPREAGVPLTDEQRGALLVDLTGGPGPS